MSSPISKRASGCALSGGWCNEGLLMKMIGKRVAAADWQGLQRSDGC